MKSIKNIKLKIESINLFWKRELQLWQTNILLQILKMQKEKIALH
mgnify:CR=1 FL=1